MKRLVLLAVVAAVALTALASCSDRAATPKPQPLQPPFAQASATDRQVLTSSNVFGFNLYRQIVDETPPPDNVFISPLSVSVALAMTYNGADNDTKQQMAEVLGFSGMTDEQINESCRTLMQALVAADPSVIFEIANSIWYRCQLEFNPDFLQTNQTYFDAEVTGLDFNDEAAAIINAWVAEKTHDKITKIVQTPINPDLVMFLINAIYFKGIWVSQFDEADTYDAPFHLYDGSDTPSRMMTQTADFAYGASEQIQTITLPYGESFFNMTVLLPKPGVSLDEVTAQLDNDTWSTWLDEQQVREIELHLPRFRFSWKASLVPSLTALGMEDAFVPFKADLSRMRAANDLFISDVKHKTFVEVNEEGTEAAAVTSVEVGITAVPPSKPVFLADRPFLFAIWERDTKAVLFLGRVMEPVLE